VMHRCAVYLPPIDIADKRVVISVRLINVIRIVLPRQFEEMRRQ
jgi:hypothetical protein